MNLHVHIVLTRRLFFNCRVTGHVFGWQNDGQADRLFNLKKKFALLMLAVVMSDTFPEVSNLSTPSRVLWFKWSLFRLLSSLRNVPNIEIDKY